jgi:prepilin-type processing-associated H-X9-DG protein
METNLSRERQGTRTRCLPGFSLVELCTVLAVSGLLLLTVVPALTRTRPGSEAARCMNNARRLVVAWQMYAHDNGDRIVVSLHGGSANDPQYGINWASGWLDWTTSTDNTNAALILTPKYGRLAAYLKATPDVFQCPADRYISAAQTARGWVRRARSSSINVGLGQGNGESGPWDTLYRHIVNTSELQYPTPAETWVFMDEHPDSINDGAAFSPYRTSWVDLPATYHNGGGGFAFADGHSEIHKWTGSLLRARGVGFLFRPIAAVAGDPDIHWMSYHAQRKSSLSY